MLRANDQIKSPFEGKLFSQQMILLDQKRETTKYLIVVFAQDKFMNQNKRLCCTLYVLKNDCSVKGEMSSSWARIFFLGSGVVL